MKLPSQIGKYVGIGALAAAVMLPGVAATCQEGCNAQNLGSGRFGGDAVEFYRLPCAEQLLGIEANVMEISNSQGKFELRDKGRDGSVDEVVGQLTNPSFAHFKIKSGTKDPDEAKELALLQEKYDTYRKILGH